MDLAVELEEGLGERGLEGGLSAGNWSCRYTLSAQCTFSTHSFHTLSTQYTFSTHSLHILNTFKVLQGDKDVKKYIKTCDSYARNKASTQAPAGLLHSMPIPEGRLLEIALDFVGMVPKSHGYDIILGMTDRLTGYVHLEPVHSTATAEQIAKVFYNSWCRTFGLPNTITSDRDKLFTSHFWKELCKKLRIHLRMSTSFHPETDGSSERSNKTLIESLRHYVNERQTDWADHLIAVEMCMNNSKNATTGKAPTELLFGAPIRLTPPVRTSNTVPAVTNFLERIRESTAIARDNHVIAKTHQTMYVNKERRPEPDYKVGDQVFLNMKNLHTRIKQKGRSAKFIARFIGPFPITKAKRETSTYTLELPPEYKIHPTFHSSLLKPAFQNDSALFLMNVLHNMRYISLNEKLLL